MWKDFGFFASTKSWTEGLEFAKQVIYHLQKGFIKLQYAKQMYY
jgi:hypothetical protein